MTWDGRTECSARHLAFFIYGYYNEGHIAQLVRAPLL